MSTLKLAIVLLLVHVATFLVLYYYLTIRQF